MGLNCCKQCRRPEFDTLPTHDVPLNDQQDASDKKRALSGFGLSWPCIWFCICCPCLAVVVVPLYYFLIQYLTNLAVDEMLVIDEVKVMRNCLDDLVPPNMTANIWWPGCGNPEGDMANLNDTCTLPCYQSEILHQMDTEWQKAFKQVFYTSRVHPSIETIQLGGWWLPAANPNASRIVIQHGFQANSNQFRPQLLAYMLRSLGYSVLMNNFRDHCYSANSTAHVYEWGHAYPYDVLGALDYARNDPDGILGGPRTSDQVGLAGISKGAFLTMITLGMEASLPGAWADAPPFTADAVFRQGASKRFRELGLPDFVFDISIDTVWENVQKAALEKDVNLTEHSPGEMLPQGPDTARPLSIVCNEDDNTVPIAECDRYKELLASYPAKYSVSDWTVKGECHGDSHCMDHFRQFTDYLARLCKFWRNVFGQAADDCPAL